MNLKDLARSKGTNIKKIAENCGIPPTTLYAISRGDTNFDNVGIGVAMKVAHALGMTVEELYTGEKPAPAPQSFLPPDEQRLVDMYRSLDADSRRTLMMNASALVALSEKDGTSGERDIELRAVDAVRAE